MSLVHEIRLAGPWQQISAADPEAAVRCTLPFSSSQQTAAAASLSLIRRFHRPANLQDTTTVRILIRAEPAIDCIALNDCQLQAEPQDAATPPATAFLVTQLLQDFNTLRIPLTSAPAEISDVRLQISEVAADT